MRSLTMKLILAFLAVSLTGVALAALFVSRGTESEFNQFLFSQGRQSLIAEISEYYRENDSWAGVEEVFPFQPIFRHGRPQLTPKGLSGITLLDDTGTVIVAGFGFHIGDQVPEADRASAELIDIDGHEVGWLILERNAFRKSHAEEAFLDQIRRTLIVSAAGATVIALLLGVFLARTLTRPLLELTSATYAVAQGDLAQMVPVRSQDELGRLAKSFNQMNAKLARLRDLRRQMTADIAHELRTPLSIIIGHAEAVEDGVLPPSRETFDIIHDEAQRLEKLIDDLQMLSLAEAGELQLSRRLVSPQSLLQNTATAYAPQAKQQDITLKIKTSPDLPDINVDPDRMAQVLGNILANSLRYSPVGSQIILSSRLISNVVELRIQDTGPGIAPVELENIFDRFYRGDKSRHRHEGGSGLGLAIAKSIVEIHGGQIRADSELGKGTTTIISIA